MATIRGSGKITGTEEADRIEGSGGNDQLYGLGGDDVLAGAGGDDLLDGGQGLDFLEGGFGNDIYMVGLGGYYEYQYGEPHYLGEMPDNVRDVGGIDEIRTSIDYFSLGKMYFTFVFSQRRPYTGGKDVENLTGLSDTGQTLVGNDLANTIRGGAGDDIIKGYELTAQRISGYDTLIGGKGNDTYTIGSGGGAIIEDPDSGRDEVITLFSRFTLPDNVENLTAGRIANYTLAGNGLDNRITGAAGADRLDGGDGADILDGGAGNDAYVADPSDMIVEAAGAGVDTVEAGFSFTLAPELENLVLTGTGAFGGHGNSLDNRIAGNGASNLLAGYKGHDTVHGWAGDDDLRGNDGDDQVHGGAGADIMSGGNGDDVLNGGGQADRVVGAAGADRLFGGGSHDALYGGDGDDFVEGGAGSDSMAGGAGRDTLSYAAEGTGVSVSLARSTSQQTGGSGLDTVSGFENLLGSAFDDTLFGDAGGNRIEGGNGDDTLDGGRGDDLLAGGDGTDRARYADAAAGVTIDLRRAVQAAGAAGTDTLIGIEDVVGSDFADALTGDALRNLLNGRDGDDVLVGLAGDDVLVAGSGADILDGGAGADRMMGGSGDDSYRVATPLDVVVELAGGGYDSVLAGSNYTLPEGVESLRLVGAGRHAVGNSLANRIRGSGAADTIRALDGDDVAAGGIGGDILYGGAGADLLFGEDGDDVLYGESGEDRLAGGDGSDVLTGGNSNDVLAGGAGRDELTGGAGADSFLFDEGDVAVSARAADMIIDFSGYHGDRIDLSPIDGDRTSGRDDSFTFIGKAGFSGDAGQVRAVVFEGNTYVVGDTDGDAGADFFIRIDGTPPLTAADFIL